MTTNLILMTDSYKASHFVQYPPNTTKVSAYIEPRVDREVVFFGLQAFIKEYLLKPITQTDVEEAKAVFSAHGEPFNYDGWLRIVTEFNGYLPLRIQAVPEGTVMRGNNVQVQIVNTHEDFYWLTSYMETALLRAVWYPSTVATLSRDVKKTLRAGLEASADGDIDAMLSFKLHDFGARGATSSEAAMLGGMAHLVNFMGTDTVEALVGAKRYYNAEMAGFSIPATEHSTITSWGRENEFKAYENLLNVFPTGLVACVSDSYNLFAALDMWGELKEKIMERDGALVVRPDSGDPVDTPIAVITKLMDIFGYTVNSKGFKVLPDKIRVIQGDGMTPDTIFAIVKKCIDQKISTDNFAVGMGGGLLQKLDRDTLRYAMKTSAIMIDGTYQDVYKDPVTDTGKKSKRGRLALVDRGFGLVTTREGDLAVGAHGAETNILRTVYDGSGILLVDDDFTTVRDRAK